MSNYRLPWSGSFVLNLIPLFTFERKKPNLGLSTKLSNHPDAAVTQQVGEIEETFQKNLSKESSGSDEVDIDPTFKK